MEMIVMKEEVCTHRSLETRRCDTPYRSTQGWTSVAQQAERGGKGNHGRSWLRAHSTGVFAGRRGWAK